MYLCALNSVNRRFCWQKTCRRVLRSPQLKKTCLQTALRFTKLIIWMGRNDSSSISAQTTPNFAQPNFIFIVVQFKMNTNYLLVKRHNLSIWITLVQQTQWPRALGHFGYCDFFSLFKQRPSHFSVWVWNGTVCHKLPFPVICQRCTADGESTGLLTDAYLTSHTFRVLYFYVSNSNCNLISLENGFLYIFLVCQCLGVFFFLYYGITLIFSNFHLFYHICKSWNTFPVSQKIFLQWPCMLLYEKKNNNKTLNLLIVAMHMLYFWRTQWDH